jgi:hypothetical protein
MGQNEIRRGELSVFPGNIAEVSYGLRMRMDTSNLPWILRIGRRSQPSSKPVGALRYDDLTEYRRLLGM